MRLRDGLSGFECTGQSDFVCVFQIRANRQPECNSCHPQVGVNFLQKISQHGDLCARYPNGLCRQLRLLSLLSMCVGACLGTLLFDVEG